MDLISVFLLTTVVVSLFGVVLLVVRLSIHRLINLLIDKTNKAIVKADEVTQTLIKAKDAVRLYASTIVSTKHPLGEVVVDSELKKTVDELKKIELAIKINDKIKNELDRLLSSLVQLEQIIR